MDPFDSLTPRGQQILQNARKEAARLGHNCIGTEHVLLGVLALNEGVAVNALQALGVDLGELREALEREAGGANPGGEAPGGNIPFSTRVKKVFSLAAKEAKALNHNYIGSEHFLLALLREGEGVAARVLAQFKVSFEAAKKEILKELDPENLVSAVAGGAEGSDPKQMKAHPLRAFGRDLTELARNGALDPVVGREREIGRVIQILARRTKNNPVLIGEPGVGKTAVVEGLAQRIATANVPEILLSKRVVALDMALVVAGTTYRGQFEARIKNIMDEVRRTRDVILFLDEMHTIVGAGNASGSLDASNIFKPALSRGELQCVGATTLDEYRKHIEKDAALERRFQPVMVEEPSVEDTIKILRGIRARYEEHHKCAYSDEALVAAARLSDRYIPARHLPDKAIDVLDEAGARARTAGFKRPEAVEEAQRALDSVLQEKEDAVAAQRYEQAGALHRVEKERREALEAAIEEWRKNPSERHVDVGEADVLRVVSDWTGIPLSRMEKKETQRLLELDAELQSAVIGQNRACSVIARALRRSRADLKDPKRPIGSFLFLGPTGVGKTMLAKTLAERVFQDPKALVQIDMSEYMEKHTVSRLVGAPPGYIGYEEGGQLSEQVRRKPYCVVLFDEIEKAHPDVVQLLLQVLEDGRLTDSLGRTVDFRNTIIIMTSNVGAEVLQRNASMGFDVGVNAERDFERVKERILDETKRVFKPEFLNRLSEIVIFSPLTRDDLGRIVDLELAKVVKRLASQDILLEVTPPARAFLIEKGYDEKYGARPLRRAIEHYLEDPLAERLIRGDLSKGGTPVSVGVAAQPAAGAREGDEGEGALSFTQKAEPATVAPTAPPPATAEPPPVKRRRGRPPKQKPQ